MRGGSGAGALRRVTEAASPVPTPVTAPEGIRPRKESSFAGDVLKMVSGTTIAQGIGVLATPLLTRMYGPEAFGTLALFTSITGIIGVVACLRYELAIMLPESDEEAANLLAVSLLSVVGVTLLTIPAVTWGRGLIVRLLNAPELGPYLWAVPVAVFFGGVFQALSYWDSRKKEFGRLSLARVVNTGSAHAAKLAGGWMRLGGGAPLIGATVLGTVLSAVMLGRFRLRKRGADLWMATGWRAVVRAAGRYRRFPFYSSWSGVLNAASWQVPPLAFSFYFDASVVGQYSLGLRVLQVPMSLIGAAIGQVFFQRAAEAHAQRRLALLVRSSIHVLTEIGFFPVLVLGVAAPVIFRLVFGPQWGVAGAYVQILSVWAFFWFLSSPLSVLVSVLEKQRFGLTVNIVIFGTRLASLCAGGLLGSPHIALAAFSLSGALVYGFLCLRLCIFSGVQYGEVLADVWHSFVRLLPFASLLVIVQAVGLDDWWVVSVAALSGIAYYGSVIRTAGGVQVLVSRLHAKTGR